LLARNPFAIMLRPLFHAAVATGVLSASWIMAPPVEAFAAPPVEAFADPDGAPDSLEWLPAPEEDTEIPEGLLEEQAAGRSGILIRSGLKRGRLTIRRVALSGERSGFRTELGLLADGKRIRPGLTHGRGSLLAAGGRVSVTRAPPLFAEAIGIERAGRRVAAPRPGGLTANPSLGASAGAMDGGAIVLRGAASVWSFAGIRAENRERLLALGLGVARNRTRFSAALGASEKGARLGSVTILRRVRGRSVSAEGLASNRGRGILAEAAARGGDMILSARWKYRSWTQRRFAAELSAETRGRDVRARLTCRSWSEDAARDDGVLELETSVGRVMLRRAPVRLRLGASGLGKDGDPAARREAYGILDATLAQDRGRSLGIHVVRRGTSGFGSRAGSTTVGTRLDIRGRRVGEHSLLVESTRLRSGAVAWGVELTPSGVTTLRQRSEPGLWVAARGGFGAGRWRLGYALGSSEDAGGPRPWSGTVWLRLWR